jgi:hypothetical protein
MREEYPARNKCVHTVAIGDWRPDLCAITLPNLERYAKRIGADFHVIRTAKFDKQGYPPNYERLQVFEDGRQYMWNLVIDADFILHKDFEDPTLRLKPCEMASLYYVQASHYFQWNKYFERDGRNLGIADSFVVSSWNTHDAWTPLDVDFEEAKKNCKRDPRQVSEFCVSLNVARFGLKHNGVTADLPKHYSVMATTDRPQDPCKMMLDKLVEWKDWEFLRSIGKEVLVPKGA